MLSPRITAVMKKQCKPETFLQVNEREGFVIPTLYPNYKENLITGTAIKTINL